MTFLTREDILKHRAPSTAEVKALGGVVRLKAMTTGERDLFEQRYNNIKNLEKGVTPNIRAFFIVHHIVDADGKLLFTVDDVESISKQPPVDMDKVFAKCQELSGFSDEDEKQLAKK